MSHSCSERFWPRMAPPAPQGWAASDAQKDGVPKEVCAEPGQKVTGHGFNRSYGRKEGMEARQAEAQTKAAAVAQNSQATMKANAAKLADAQKRMQDLQKKVGDLVAARKYTDVEALSKDSEKIMAEIQQLMNVDATDAAAKSIDAELRHDTGASFSLRIGVTDLDTRGFSPVTIGAIRAFRQLTRAEGSHPETAQLIIVVKPATAPKGPQTVVYVDGDPARAEALLKAATLQ